MFSIRPALPEDINAIRALDPFAQGEERHAFIQRSVEADNCYVLEKDRRIIAYGVLEYSFYEQGFISMLFVHPDYRRHGSGSMLMRHFEFVCQTAKIFTSTNLSNLPMQSLLAKLEYTLSGIIHHLDEGDPELVYVKYLKKA